MAKKKAAKKKKKTAKKRAAKKVSGPAAVEAPEAKAGSYSDQELVTAGVVTAGGELLAGLATGIIREVEARGINVADLLSTVVANLQCSQMTARVSGEENGQSGWEYARRQLELRDNGDLPRLRFVGRVLDVLLNHRRFTTCSGGDVFRVFLIEIPDQLEEQHRQHPPPAKNVDITEPSGRKMFTNRMKSLRQMELIRPTITRDTGRGEGYVLTENGRNMFDGWPPLSDIPGLELDGLVRPDSQSRPRS